MSLVVRLATDADLPSLVAIYNEGIRARTATFETDERTAAEVAPWLKWPASPVFVAEADRSVIGWTRAAEYRPRAAYSGIRDVAIYVTEGARRRGVGDALIGALVAECQRLGHYKLVSRIFRENIASLALSRRHGFREVGVYERHGQIDGAWRDVIIVERLIGRGAQ